MGNEGNGADDRDEIDRLALGQATEPAQEPTAEAVDESPAEDEPVADAAPEAAEEPEADAE